MPTSPIPRPPALDRLGYRSPRRNLLAIVALLTAPLVLVLHGCGESSSPDPSTSVASPSTEDGATTATSIDVRVEPFTDFYFWTRAQAAGVVEVMPEFQPIIDAWMPVQDERGAWGGFWRFDLAGMLATSPEEFGAWFDERDEFVPSRAGGQIPIRGPGKAMAEAMAPIWPRFLEEHWPQRRELLVDAKEQLDRDFMPDHRRAFQYMLDSLGIVDPEIELPTYLTLDTHPPGASTFRTNEGAAAVLSTRELLSEGRFSDLAETVLHESTHALDIASRGDGDAFTRLRGKLEERGIERGDPRHHDVPHLIMFVQSEETMRRLYDSDHLAYGDTQRGDIAPLYERQGEASGIVRREWRRYLDGEIDLEQALENIADQAAGRP